MLGFIQYGSRLFGIDASSDSAKFQDDWLSESGLNVKFQNQKWRKMANLTNEKAEFAIAIFRHFSPLALRPCYGPLFPARAKRAPRNKGTVTWAHIGPPPSESRFKIAGGCARRTKPVRSSVCKFVVVGLRYCNLQSSLPARRERSFVPAFT